MKITAQDLLEFKVIDGIISEPAGGAHRGKHETIAATEAQIAEALAELSEDGLDLKKNAPRNLWPLGVIFNALD